MFEWQQHLFGSEQKEVHRQRRGARIPSLASTLEESLDKPERSGLQAYPPPFLRQLAFHQLGLLKNTAFTAKWELYGVISNTEIPVKKRKLEGGSERGLLLCGELVLEAFDGANRTMSVFFVLFLAENAAAEQNAGLHASRACF